MRESFFQTLLDISKQLAENRTLNPLLDYAMTVAMELFGAESGYLILLNRDGTLDFRVKRTRDGQELERPEEQISQTILRQVIGNCEGLIIADAISDRAFQAADSVVSLKLRSVICAPLISRGEILGALYLENRAQTGLFTEDDLALLELFASQAAVAIENATLNDELEARVAARTAELQARNEELNAFAHIVAHDLKIPLTSIIGYAEIVKDGRVHLPREELLRCMGAIVRGGEKMNKIIDELFLLASLRREEVPSTPLDMTVVVADVLQRLAYMVEECQGKIVVPDDWPAALGYAPWVEEVWANYLSNALKYGGQPPYVEIGADLQQDGMVRFWVQDNGIGLTAEDQTHLFTPFTQLARDRSEGQGLGLSIVRRIVEKLGGQVRVESEIGQGSVFSFTLPGAVD